MINSISKNSFEKNVLTPTRIAVVSYAVVKQIFYTAIVGGTFAVYRLLISAVWVPAILIVTRSKRLSRRTIALIVLPLSVMQEIVFYVLVGGDRLIFPFLIGCALLSVMYADIVVIAVTIILSFTSISICLFVLGIDTVGEEYNFADLISNEAGLLMVCMMIYLISKHTIGTLAKARLAAESSDRAKSEFLATMSHEIRTPLNAIIGIAQIELQKEGVPDAYAEAFDKIYNSGSSLLGIINDILDMSKIESGKLELNPAEYDVPSLINDTAQLNVVRIGSKPLELLLDVDERLPCCLWGDELRIKQILNNLLSNAIKYTEKGHVRLAVSHTQEDGEVWLSLVVEDTGQGLRPEDKERLFSEYTRFYAENNRTVEGTGLGLNITKRLVEMMGGVIEVESEFGKGSTFIVNIRQKAVECPAIGAVLADKLSRFSYESVRRTEQLNIARTPMPYGRVLVVDDAETNLYVAQGLLAPYQLAIETANSGFVAIGKVESGEAYDVIFMDHMMPLMDGVEATKRLRDMGYNGAIVALTANALAGNDVMFRENGFDDFIPKPIDTRELNECLNTYIRDRHPEQAGQYRAEEVAVQELPASRVSKELLAVFRRDAAKAVGVLRETAKNGDLKLFTTTAHAMKSALANVGEKELSETAAKLEKAGREGDWSYIIAHAAGFADTLAALLDKMVSLAGDGGGGSGGIDRSGQDDGEIVEDSAFLAEQLQLVKQACEAYDDTAAYAVLERLQEKAWKKETAQMLAEIHDDLFLNSDFDRVVEKIESASR